MSVVIKAENLCKTYKIYNKRLDRLKETFLPFKKQYNTPFHALDDINIEIKKGDTVGIVGRNGSGKSTLLQIICGILQPTSGSIQVDGRISALLELGAGFNPEFTGLENVYLNASILGMKKQEIDDCLDDILGFADIGRFVDQPVKTYSSGMYVRLAFAVAINVRPDILIVDEALSVGDTLFQAKCFAKFKEFQDKGITILFVTHSDDLVTRYCKSALMLDFGKQLMYGRAKDVVDSYNRLLAGVGCDDDSSKQDRKEKINKEGENEPHRMPLTINPNENRYGSGAAEIIQFGVNSLQNDISTSFQQGRPYEFWVEVKFNKDIFSPIVAYTIKDIKGLQITGTNTLYKQKNIKPMTAGETLKISFTHDMLVNAGEYLLSFGCTGFEDGEFVVYDRRFDVVAFRVVSAQQGVGVFDLDSKIKITYYDSVNGQ